jgi:uncharacterized protein (TIGR02588 family)
MDESKSDNQAKDGQEKDGQEKEKRGKNALEWTIFGLSSLLVLGVLVFLGLEVVHGAKTPPRLEITLGEPVKAGDRMLVPVAVENRGDSTAASVNVEVSRRKSDEKAGFSFSHLPRGGRRQGWVAFDAPLQKADLEAQILGYEEP